MIIVLTLLTEENLVSIITAFHEDLAIIITNTIARYPITRGRSVVNVD